MGKINYLRDWTAETLEAFKRDAPNYSARELAKLYNIPSSATVSSIRRRLHIVTNQETKDRLREKCTRLTKEAVARISPERMKVIREHNRLAEIETLKRERRRILFGLPQQTNRHLVIDKTFSDKRKTAKGRMRARNKYLNDEKRSRNVLLYDSNTIRSAYLEKKYSNLITFLPVSGLDVSTCKWTDDRRWK